MCFILKYFSSSNLVMVKKNLDFKKYLICDLYTFDRSKNSVFQSWKGSSMCQAQFSRLQMKKLIIVTYHYVI